MLAGADNWSVEVNPNPDPQLSSPVHQIMLAVHGIHLVEKLKLEELASEQSVRVRLYPSATENPGRHRLESGARSLFERWPSTEQTLQQSHASSRSVVAGQSLARASLTRPVDGPHAPWLISSGIFRGARRFRPSWLAPGTILIPETERIRLEPQRRSDARRDRDRTTSRRPLPIVVMSTDQFT